MTVESVACTACGSESPTLIAWVDDLPYCHSVPTDPYWDEESGEWMVSPPSCYEKQKAARVFSARFLAAT